jgi:hypothetical protein
MGYILKKYVVYMTMPDEMLRSYKTPSKCSS